MKRHTRQRDVVSRVLDLQAGFVSAQDLHQRIVDAGDVIGLATVYRTLASLAAEGRVDALARPDGTTMYRACSTSDHHHHLICHTCGKTVDIEAGPVEAWARDVARAHGFVQAQHVVDVYGLCPACAV